MPNTGLSPRIPIRAYLGGVTLAIAALAVALPVNLIVPEATLGRVFLVGILISAISFGLWPSIFASLISAIVYDFFFLPPYYSLSVSSPRDLVDLICFLVIAVIVSALAARVRRYAVAADERAITAEKLADFAARMTEAATVESAIATAAEHLSGHLGLPVAILIPRQDGAETVAASPSGRPPSQSAIGAARRLWLAERVEESAGEGWRVRRLRASENPMGLLLIGTEEVLTEHQRDLIEPLSTHVALVIERFSLQQRLLDARLQREAEALRATVLTSLSHDVRAPLSNIVAGVSVLRSQWDRLTDATKQDTVRTMLGEADRLNQFIGKLLDMTRLEHDAVVPNTEPVYAGEIVCSALDVLQASIIGHPVRLDIPDDLPLADADPVLLQQVMVNLIDNAAKYSPATAPIEVRAMSDNAFVRLDVIDEGSGIRDADLPYLFDRFYRVRNGEGIAPGTGLGLAICRGFVRVMRGSIEAANRTDRCGAIFSVMLPMSARPGAVEVPS